MSRQPHAEVRLSGLHAGTSYSVLHHNVDADHSNIAAVWDRQRRDGQDWPDDAQWEALRAADRLDEVEHKRTLATDERGTVIVRFSLPMPGVSLLELDGFTQT